MAKLLEQLLRETIERGTGENMAALAEWVIQTFRQHHAELPKLRAYTWAAHILGQRILRGEFAPPPSPPPAAPEPPPPGAQPLDISDDLGGGAYTDVSPPSLVDGRSSTAAASSKEQPHVACAPSVARPPASSPRARACALAHPVVVVVVVEQPSWLCKQGPAVGRASFRFSRRRFSRRPPRRRRRRQSRPSQRSSLCGRTRRAVI